MDGTEADLFGPQFRAAIRSLIQQHHLLYPWLPPQGIFFEALVYNAFRAAGWNHAQLVPTSPNAPQHDLLVGHRRLSIKTETGKITRPDRISITKLCTTEREPWDAPTLVGHVLEHLSRHDHMLMLRAVWRPEPIRYQLVEIPITLLQRIEAVRLEPVGRRTGRRSQGGDVFEASQRVFHVHFDGADGKCQIRNLLIDRCRMLAEWNQPAELGPTHSGQTS